MEILKLYIKLSLPLATRCAINAQANSRQLIPVNTVITTSTAKETSGICQVFVFVNYLSSLSLHPYEENRFHSPKSTAGTGGVPAINGGMPME